MDISVCISHLIRGKIVVSRLELCLFIDQIDESSWVLIEIERNKFGLKRVPIAITIGNYNPQRWWILEEWLILDVTVDTCRVAAT